MKMRGLLLICASFVLTFSVIFNAWLQKKQFYPTIVYLTKSSPCVAVLYVQTFVFVLLFAKLIKKVFFGQLRPAETEHLIERSWYAVTDTCLAFTMFRDDFSPIFVGAFTLLLFLKSFHWLLEDRVDYMERSPRISFIFKFRVLSLLTTLFLSDLFFVNFSYYSTITKGPSVQIVFGFEYAILATIVLTIFLKYVLHSIDLQSENPWENKALYMLYVELVTGFLRVLLYICFTVLMVKVHTFPLFSIRPMYLTMRHFKKSVTDIILSRRAIRNMNNLYPDATAEELANADSTCIICREEMEAPDSNNPALRRNTYDAGVNKKLPCGHIFHASCLRSWFQRQQTCPTCRLDVLQTSLSFDSGQTPAAPAAAPPNNPPPPPPVPPPFPPMFPHMHPNIFPRFPNPSPANLENHPSSTSDSASNPSSFPFTPPPVPPFATLFGPPPFIPPPFPPPQFNGMSDEQLREMEGEERKNVEARIECLRNINRLLDAAMIQISQYMAAAGPDNYRLRVQSTLNPSASLSTTMATEEFGSNVSNKGDHQSLLEATPKLDTECKNIESAVEEDASSSAESNSFPDNDELRRRRLKKLSAAPRSDQIADVS